MKALSEKWGSLTEKQKVKYVQLAEQDQQRYLNEMSSLQLNGFYINSDGVKSTDLKVKKKKGTLSQTQTLS